MQSDTNTRSVTLNCAACGKAFRMPRSRAMRGGRFCSEGCYHSSRRGTRRAVPVTLTCEECGRPFEIKKKVINRALRDGYKPRPFCGRECYEASLKRRPAANFWRKVKTSESCWLWIGNFLENGYGQISIGAKRKQLAHRFSYELHYGPIPEDMFVCHRCDNPPCVRPDHLFLGTALSNHADMRTKKRDAFGTRHPNAKLTDEQVRDIRSRYSFRKTHCRKLAQEFNVSYSTVLRVVKGQRWRHVA